MTHFRNMLYGHCTKLQKYSVCINNVQLAKRQVKQVSFSHSSERQQGVRILYLVWQTVCRSHGFYLFCFLSLYSCILVVSWNKLCFFFGTCLCCSVVDDPVVHVVLSVGSSWPPPRRVVPSPRGPVAELGGPVFGAIHPDFELRVPTSVVVAGGGAASRAEYAERAADVREAETRGPCVSRSSASGSGQPSQLARWTEWSHGERRWFIVQLVRGVNEK